MKIYEAAELIKENKISSVELTKGVLKNIEACDERVYITLCDDMLLQAERADKEKKSFPLAGIPLGIKDSFCTKGVVTTAASKILSDYVPCYDATAVKRLKENGAVIVGKTSMDEFGMGNSNENSAYGAISNPINKEFVPGGSSGGSAVAVKTGMALGALGSDTGGSVRQPASFCGLYSLKPTYSLISRFGLIAFASSLDCVGPICQSSIDLAIMTSAMAGFDEMDATSAKREVVDYTKSLTGDIKGLKIGVPVEYFENMEPDIKKAVIDSIENFKSMGAEVYECSHPSLKYSVSTYYIISSCEASSNLARYDGVRFGKRGEGYDNIEEMYVKTRSENLGREVKKRILLGTEMLRGDNYDIYYLKAKKARNLIKRDFDRLFEKYDALLAPISLEGVWKKGAVKDTKDKFSKDFCTVSVSLAGLPSVSFPCGKDKNNMPVGLQIIGKPFSEAVILNVAYSFEKGGFSYEF